MKTYIILTGSIFDMGGAEMFTSNKCTYLKNNGWNVRVFYFNKGHEILIDNLKEFVNNYIYELKYGFYYWNEKRRKYILERICNGLGKNDEIVVESHLIGLAYWGELISKHIGAKSILNCMEENIRQLSPLEASFVEYKVLRYEVLNGTPRSFQRYFGKLYKQKYNKYVNTMIPLCSNVVSENRRVEIDIPIADFNLLSIGRLDKPYIQTMLNEVRVFVESFNQFVFNLLVIGGSPDGSVEKHIQKIFEQHTNVNVCLFGYLYPVPADLIRKADVGMASANSVLVTANHGIPTIVYDMVDFQTVGIFGYTTNNRFRRQIESAVPAEILLKEILIDKKYKKTEALSDDFEQFEKVFAPQLEFLSKSPNDHNFYEVENIYSTKDYIIGHFKSIIHTIKNRMVSTQIRAKF